MPERSLQLDEPVGASPQMPSCWFIPLRQLPLQQSPCMLQTSPCWLQNELGEQMPALHSCEQHWPFVMHVLPRVLQSGLSGTQFPLVQFLPQHSALVMQLWLSDVHFGQSQTPPLHVWLQQSLFAVHADPRFRQLPLLQNGAHPASSVEPPSSSPVSTVPSCPPSPVPLSSPQWTNALAIKSADVALNSAKIRPLFVPVGVRAGFGMGQV